MEISKLLLQWYDRNARSLPWRGTRDPYRIWLSEIMLQQTRAEAVARYYDRFLARFPDVRALAAAGEDEVLKLWEGLGYYFRARNLHAAARRVAEAGGQFPRTVEGLQALPGVGPYAARAIASIAYDARVPALDGNQMRVLSRCFAVERVLKTPFDLEAEAVGCLSAERPGDYNQALMDLGARICTPKRPKCLICPLSPVCRAREEGEPERYPLRPAPTAKREEARTVFLIEAPRGICIRRRDGEKLLGGLYEFPSAGGWLSRESAEALLTEAGYGELTDFASLPPAKHVFTHMIWRMQGWRLRARRAPEEVLQADAEALRGRAFPSALRKYREIALEMLADFSPSPEDSPLKEQVECDKMIERQVLPITKDPTET